MYNVGKETTIYTSRNRNPSPNALRAEGKKKQNNPISASPSLDNNAEPEKVLENTSASSSSSSLSSTAAASAYTFGSDIHGQKKLTLKTVAKGEIPPLDASFVVSDLVELIEIEHENVKKEAELLKQRLAILTTRQVLDGLAEVLKKAHKEKGCGIIDTNFLSFPGLIQHSQNCSSKYIRKKSQLSAGDTDLILLLWKRLSVLLHVVPNDTIFVRAGTVFSDDSPYPLDAVIGLCKQMNLHVEVV